MLTLKEINDKISLEVLRYINNFVINSSRFMEGYGAKSHHHNYNGGLLTHTTEVANNCLKIGSALGLDLDILLTAAIWHDYCKIFDYIEKDGKIEYTDYKERIYHISGSTMEFYHRAREVALEAKLRDAIVHCILSHHGRPEWGSSISPKSKEALTLHYADCMSSWFADGGYKEK